MGGCPRHLAQTEGLRALNAVEHSHRSAEGRGPWKPAHLGSNPSSTAFRLHDWAGHLTSLSLSFLTCKMEIISVRTLRVVRTKLLEQYQPTLSSK